MNSEISKLYRPVELPAPSKVNTNGSINLDPPGNITLDGNVNSLDNTIQDAKVEENLKSIKDDLSPGL